MGREKWSGEKLIQGNVYHPGFLVSSAGRRITQGWSPDNGYLPIAQIVRISKKISSPEA
jgi:hypothetical protein